MRLALAQLAVVGVACAIACACASRAPEPAAAGASNAANTGRGDWSQFEGGHAPIDPKNARVVPETPVEITNVPYVRGVRLSWSTEDAVPSYESDNETLKLPGSTKQAVLAVAVANLPDGADIDEQRGKIHCTVRSTVGDHQFCRPERQQRLDHAARRAPGTQDQNPLVGDFEAQVLSQVGDQTVAVGVVAEQAVLGVHHECVDRARAVGAQREFVGQLRRRFLVWYGHVQPASAAREELQHLRAEIARRDVIEAIDEGLIRLLGEQPVDERRPAVTDGMSDHPVLIRGVHRG